MVPVVGLKNISNRIIMANSRTMKTPPGAPKVSTFLRITSKKLTPSSQLGLDFYFRAHTRRNKHSNRCQPIALFCFPNTSQLLDNRPL
jgi:hypothetical protein